MTVATTDPAAKAGAPKLLSVADAHARVMALAGRLGTERVPLAQAAGRVLAADVVATRAQPPSMPPPWTAMRCAPPTSRRAHGLR